MVKVYGISDAEREFLSSIEGRFREVVIQSFDDFQAFADNPYRFKRKMEDALNNQIMEASEKLASCQGNIADIKAEIDRLNYRMRKKINTKKKTYGQLRETIQEEIDDLIAKRDNLSKKKAEKEKAKRAMQQKIKSCRQRKEKVMNNIDSDIKLVRRLQKDYDTRNMMKGIWGEREVIKHLEKALRDLDNTHLINSFNFESIAEAININDRTITENRIDHVLVCPKGCFILETKAWSTVTERGIKKIQHQLKKTDIAFNKIFGKEIEENQIDIVLVCTKKPITLPDKSNYTSLKINELKEYVLHKNDVLGKDEITMILNTLLPHLDENHVSTPAKIYLKAKGLFVKSKRFLRRSDA